MDAIGKKQLISKDKVENMAKLFIDSANEMLKIREFIFFDPNKSTNEIKIKINEEITEKLKVYHEATIAEGKFTIENYQAFKENIEAKNEQDRQDVLKKYQKTFEKYEKVRESKNNTYHDLVATFDKWMK